jgi:hypothetical protein
MTIPGRAHMIIDIRNETAQSFSPYTKATRRGTIRHPAINMRKYP